MSQREVVMFPGKLEGMGKEAGCTVGAVRVPLPGTSESALSRLSVHNAPPDLPEGHYALTIHDGVRTEKVAVRKHAGAWISASV